MLPLDSLKICLKEMRLLCNFQPLSSGLEKSYVFYDLAINTVNMLNSYSLFSFISAFLFLTALGLHCCVWAFLVAASEATL